MTKDFEELKKIKEKHEDDLLSKANVIGVDIGYKYIKGKKTNEIVIRTFVEKKEDVSEKDLVPKKIDGITTDVIETSKIELQVLKVPVDAPVLQEETRHFEPLTGGIELGPCRVINGSVYMGTLGAIVKKGNDFYALSNFHVMCVDGNWNKGDDIVQPSRAHGGDCQSDLIGKIDDVCLANKYGKVENQVDAAISTIKNRTITPDEVFKIGKIKGAANPKFGDMVRKHGRTTNLTYGEIDGLNATVSISYGEGIGVVTLRNQISIAPDRTRNDAFSKPGDSGSVIVDSDNKIVGLLFAGANDHSHTFANHFSEVEKALGISLVTESLAGV
ncbi:hypothetical protein [Paenibacillus sp. TY11]|uniref:hypothetical protein n=1 Tax=Paenibacillus sp. TY11 TaxID=3448633 RepID=UPI004039EEDF